MKIVNWGKGFGSGKESWRNVVGDTGIEPVASSV